jgi:hypothetical protein
MYQLTQHPESAKSCCITCVHARLQVCDKNKTVLDEYASPGIIIEYHQKVEVTAVCTATGQINKPGQISACELHEMC